MTGPQTYHEAIDLSLPDQIGRYEELTDRNLMARSIATLQARGEFDARTSTRIRPNTSR